MTERGEREYLVNFNRHLASVVLRFKPYTRYTETWDHDHCEICYKTLVESRDVIHFAGDTLAHEGYVTLDNYHWICKECFEEYKEDFNWVIETEQHER